MSIPPSNLPPNAPPGGNYYVAPRPPASSSGGCWKAAGLTCGVVFLIVLIGGIVAVNKFKSAMQHPSKNNFIGIGVEVGQATADGFKLQQAIVQYHQKNGKYPATLMALVMGGEIDGKILHSDLDSNPSPAHISWRYHKPAKGASGPVPLLELPYTLDFVPGHPQQSALIVNLDGSVMSNAGAGVPYPPNHGMGNAP